MRKKIVTILDLEDEDPNVVPLNSVDHIIRDTPEINLQRQLTTRLQRRAIFLVTTPLQRRILYRFFVDMDGETAENRDELIAEELQIPVSEVRQHRIWAQNILREDYPKTHAALKRQLEKNRRVVPLNTAFS